MRALTTIRHRSVTVGHVRFCLCTHFSMTAGTSQHPSSTTALSPTHAPSILAVKSRINARPSDYYKDNMNNVSEDLYTIQRKQLHAAAIVQSERYNSNPRGQMVIVPNKVDDMALLRFLLFLQW